MTLKHRQHTLRVVAGGGAPTTTAMVRRGSLLAVGLWLVLCSAPPFAARVSFGVKLVGASSAPPISNYETDTLSWRSCDDHTSWGNYDNVDGTVPGEWVAHRHAALSASPNPSYSTPLDLGLGEPFTSPAMTIENASWWVSPNGFVAMSPNSMCPSDNGFCANSVDGWYKFNSGIRPSGGGSWPLIGAYVANLDARATATSAEYGAPALMTRPLRQGTQSGSPVVAMEVQYGALSQYSASNPTGARGEGQQVVAKAVLWRNGTVVLKYNAVPRSILLSDGSQDFYFPSAGLALPLSHSRFVTYALAPGSRDGSPTRCAMRMQPVRDDRCANRSASCQECVTPQQDDEFTCAWCATRSTCVITSIAYDVCPDTYGLAMYNETSVCPRGSADDKSDTAPGTQQPQRFYGVTVSQPTSSDATFAARTIRQIITRPSAVRRVTGFNVTARDVAPAHVDLPFDMPLFDFPAQPAPSAEALLQRRRVKSVAVSPAGPTVSFSAETAAKASGTVKPACSWATYLQLAEEAQAITSPTHEGEGDVVCVPVGTGAMELRPYASARLVMDPLFGLHSAVVTSRDDLEALVNATFPQVNGTTPAAGPPQNTSVAFVLTFAHVVYGDRGFPVAPPTEFADVANATFYVVLWPDGSITTTYSFFVTQGPHAVGRTAPSPAPVFPQPAFALAGRDGVSSATHVGWAALVPGSTVQLSPVYGCPDCFGRGTCNVTTLQCECVTGFDGARCDACAEGFFGEMCRACPTCQNGGLCNDGVTGMGYCQCTGGYSGEYCERLCTVAPSSHDGGAGVTAAPALDVVCDPACNPQGGYCSCGKCMCFTDRGWHGATCHEWSDPCVRLSLDGCSACLNSSTVRCNYCLNEEFLCVAAEYQPTVEGLPIKANGSKCTAGFLTPAGSLACTAFNYRVARENGAVGSSTGFDLIVLATLAILATAGLIAFGAYRVHLRPRRGNELIRQAAMALPNRRRVGASMSNGRAVIAFRFVSNPPGRSRNVQALPLKQIELGALYRYQQARDAAAAAATTTASTTEDQELSPMRDNSELVREALEELRLDRMDFAHDAEIQSLIDEPPPRRATRSTAQRRSASRDAPTNETDAERDDRRRRRRERRERAAAAVAAGATVGGNGDRSEADRQIEQALRQQVLNQQRLQQQRTAQARAVSEGGGSPTAVAAERRRRQEGRRQSSSVFTDTSASPPRALSPRSGSSSAGSPHAAARPPRAAAYRVNDDNNDGEAPS